MKKHFIFCHGFGFDKNFWDNLVPYFAKNCTTYIDLGYFNNKLDFSPKNGDMPTIGIGHSLGLLKLLKLKQQFDCLIGLNGFVNFLGNDDKLRKNRHQELERLKRNFKKSTITTMESFYKKCRISANMEKVHEINKDVAFNDLEYLSENISIPSHTSMLVIGAKDDVIVPPEVLWDNFNNHPNVAIQIMDQGKHGLGFTAPIEVHKRIINFVDGLY